MNHRVSRWLAGFALALALLASYVLGANAPAALADELPPPTPTPIQPNGGPGSGGGNGGM